MTEAEKDTTDGRYTVFITMHSTPETSFFDWERQLEELRGLLGENIFASDWDKTQVYGPDAQGFSTPAICVRAALTGTKLRTLMKELESVELRTWLPRVDLHIATRLNDDNGAFFEMLEMLEAVKA